MGLQFLVFSTWLISLLRTPFLYREYNPRKTPLSESFICRGTTDVITISKMIKGKHINLRMIKEGDLDTYFEIINDLSNMSPYWPANLRSDVSLRKEFSENGFWEDDQKLLLITDKEGNLVGELGSFKTSPNIKGPEIAYRIFQKEDMGKGYMTEALELFSAYLFRTNTNILRLTLLILSGNAGSLRVAQKCGYVREGTLRNACISDGILRSYEVLSLLREECPKLDELIAVV